ncbi:SDR family oxidoreductase [Rhodobacterales bacterium HKCCE2091]|nr:SDR family oxidoreductase [Rhodobacterales bacterium HKCCE2091]
MTALVTGAGARLGQAMAVALAHAGHDVAVHYASSSEGAERTAEAVRAAGRKAVTLQADLLDEDDCQALVPRAAEALGPLTVLVNNASIFEYDDIETATRETWDRHIGSNLRAPFVLTQAFARQAPDPETDERGEPEARALVVNMIDQRVRKLTPDFMTYTIAKMGLWAFTRTAAQALGPKVRVNGIGPGPTLIAEGQSEAHFARQRARTALGRGSNPEDIVGALLYLLRAPAITGQLLCVDGGQHLIWHGTPEAEGA